MGMLNGDRHAHWELMKIVFKNSKPGCLRELRKMAGFFLKKTIFAITNENDPLKVKRNSI